MSKTRTSMEQTRRRYVWRTSAALGAFGLIYVAANAIYPDPTRILGIAFTVFTVAPLIYWAYEYQVFIRALDELQSLLSLQAIAIGAGGTFLLGAFWGVAEKFLNAPHLNPALLLPIAAVLNSLVLFVLSRRYE